MTTDLLTGPALLAAVRERIGQRRKVLRICQAATPHQLALLDCILALCVRQEAGHANGCSAMCSDGCCVVVGNSCDCGHYAAEDALRAFLRAR